MTINIVKSVLFFTQAIMWARAGAHANANLEHSERNCGICVCVALVALMLGVAL